MAQLSQDQLSRYTRQVILPEVGVDGQAKLLQSKVLIIGAGGLGAPSSIYLAAAGVGTIGMIDADTVDRTNLHRQVVHDDADVGRPKTTSAKERLEAQNPDVKVIEHPIYLDSSNALDIIGQYDVVVNGCDNFATRYLVNDACVLLGKPLVDASILRFEGQATVFLPEQGCYRCLFPEPPPPGMVPNCAEAGIIGALAGHMGTLQAVEVIKILLGIGKPLIGKLLLYDALEAEYRTVKWRKDPNCPVCSENPTVTELIDYEQFCGLPSTNGVQNGSTDVAQVGAASDDGLDDYEGNLQDALAERGWARVPSEVKDKVGSTDVQWIDIREPQEVAMFRIEGSVHIPQKELPSRLDEIDPDKDAIIVCLSGERSSHATVDLRRKGFDKTYNLTGGLVSWVNERFPVER